jgi:hypothetical protein
MTRARAVWLAAAVVVLAAVGYLLVRRRPDRTPTRAIRLTVEAPISEPTLIEPPINEPPINEPAAAVTSRAMDTVDPVEDDEQPLATWVRVAIVAVALLAFFAVSLIATKQV